ncbi:hypothetical protein NEOLEDRAFT_647004 [Neolentinus lepideus HHB14362 ss-1]|uniref:Uncharacterized protein n=1 Tax=Neolentinus lepideus HHB14362 ss-1 TaxID=1314782 RepID=A0A165QHP3_9AGAM|nr:hypothetical protein NEOLEDRAFT_647004 [Neolentinus lepideus HHB14362 ss-1]
MFLFRRGKSKRTKASAGYSRSTPATPHFGFRTVGTDDGHEVLGHAEANRGGLMGREAAMEAELAELREQCDAMRDTMRSLALERDAGLRDAHAKEREILEAKRYMTTLKDQLVASENRRDMLQQDADDVQRRMSILEEQAQMANELLKVKDGALMELQRKNGSLAASHSRTLALLQAKAVELESVQAFIDIGRVDTVSEDDVFRAMRELNAKILDTAIVLADALQYESKHRTPDGDRIPIDKATNRVKEMLGPLVVQRLNDCPEREDAAIVIQIAFQGCMVLHCAWQIAAWHFDFELARECKLLQEMYDHVRQNEPQVVFSRWRSVARKHIQSMRHGDSPDSATPSLISQLIKRLVDVLLVAGCNATKESQVHEMIMNVYGDRLQTVIHLALGLNKIVGIDALSCDYEPVWTRPDVPFNSVWMEDMDGKEEGDKQTLDGPTVVRVLCTTGVGLRQKVKAGPRQRRKSRSDLKSMLVIKPRVALETVLHERRRLEVRNSWSASGASVLGSDGSER